MFNLSSLFDTARSGQQISSSTERFHKRSTTGFIPNASTFIFSSHNPIHLLGQPFVLLFDHTTARTTEWNIFHPSASVFLHIIRVSSTDGFRPLVCARAGCFRATSGRRGSRAGTRRGRRCRRCELRPWLRRRLASSRRSCWDVVRISRCRWRERSRRRWCCPWRPELMPEQSQ